MREPKRILQVFGTLNRGGAESMIMNIYRNIDRNIIQFDFIANEQPTPYAFEDEIRSLGGNIYFVPQYIGSNHILYKNKWEKLFKSHPEWEIIHAHHTTPAYIFFEIAKQYDIKTIAHSHIAGNEINLKASLKKVFRFPLRYKSDYLMACSNGAADWMFGRKSQTEVLYNAIDTSSFSFDLNKREKKRKELNLGDKMVLGHVGRFDAQKNHTFLIDIFNEYHKSNPNSILLLVGEGNLKDIIIKKVKEYGLANSVMFLGMRKDVEELLQAIDMFLFPSLYEGLPVTLVEAQTAGLPIVASDKITREVEITELITFVSLKESTNIWAQKIIEQSKIQRKNRAIEVGQAGYDIKKTSKNLQNFYMSI